MAAAVAGTAQFALSAAAHRSMNLGHGEPCLMQPVGRLAM
jgi:hypothetical protein